MSVCEKCWSDAHVIYAMGQGRGESLVAVYHELLEERDPCSPQEQAGDYWDPVRKIDARDLVRGAADD